MIIRPGSASAAAAVQTAEASPAAAPVAAASEDEGPLGKITVISGPHVGKELELKKKLITLGRPGVQVAVITRRPNGYFITHVEGQHPMVNEQDIGSQAHELKDNDVIELASVKMQFSTG